MNFKSVWLFTAAIGFIITSTITGAVWGFIIGFSCSLLKLGYDEYQNGSY